MSINQNYASAEAPLGLKPGNQTSEHKLTRTSIGLSAMTMFLAAAFGFLTAFHVWSPTELQEQAVYTLVGAVWVAGPLAVAASAGFYTAGRSFLKAKAVEGGATLR